MDVKKKGGQPSILKLVIIIVAVILILSLLKGMGGNSAQEEDITYYTPAASMYTYDWGQESNVAQDIPAEPVTVNGIRDKYTHLKGNNRDKVTIMVYMCGSDLESQSAMGSYDLNEMATAILGSNVDLIVLTGGTTQWHIDGISNKVNQIFRVAGNGQIYCLEQNAGTAPMVDPGNLTDFIEYCTDNYEADRYGLIFWDHGGGTVSGYGHDLKYPNAGSMTLDKIDKALTDADVKFDFIGFDACLMATTETALMLAEHADYMIASEESEPGIGWYYTPWLNALGQNSSLPTVELGKSIADSFVSKCKTDVPRQSATLSVVDLAELEYTVPARLTAFAKSAGSMISDGQYRQIASARASSRDFGTSAKVDMVDLVDLTDKIGSAEAQDLQNALLSCIKYNNTSRDMTNSYGLSIYFPYRSTQYVNTVLATYKSIDMDSEYSDCIRSFATYQTSGQISGGGSHNAYQSFGSYGGGSAYSQQGSAEDIYDLLNLFMGGGCSTQDSYSGYYGSGLDQLFFGRSIDPAMTQFIADNHFDGDLTWKDGKIGLTRDQWSLIADLELNMFIDDGTGYIDLGKDNIYDIDKKGNLLKQEDLTWLAASADGENWQVVPYYYISSQTDGANLVSTGRIPVLFNGQEANLIIQLDDAGIEVAGISFGYDTAIMAKNLSALEAGDELQFVCDYYDYDGNFNDSYVLGNTLVVADQLYLGDVDISAYKTLASYEFVDIYQQSYWTTEMK